MISPDFLLETQAIAEGLTVCGIDEAGRGPWAGPVVAAAVSLDSANIPPGLNDSKKLTQARREALFPAILAAARVGIGEASVREIDSLNILKATFLAMERAVHASYPGYGFAAHKGYGTPAHAAMLARLGPCPLHRKSFAPVRALLDSRFG